MTDQRDIRARECARNALATLPGIERWLCGALISRQLDHGPKIPREVEKYGPEGCIQICSGRAFQVYLLLFGVLGVAMVLAHVAPGAITLFILAGSSSVLGISRAVSASKAGRRWRSRPHPDLSKESRQGLASSKDAPSPPESH